MVSDLFEKEVNPTSTTRRKRKFRIMRAIRASFLRTYHRGLSSSSCWATLGASKSLLGANTLVLLPTESQNNKALQGRLMFELQMLGVNPVRYTMKELFPTASSSAEATKVAQRTGARSVVAMGTGSVCDSGKDVRAALEGDGGGGEVPLLVIPTSFSPLPLLPLRGVLHKEEDVLVVAKHRAPTVVAMDGDVLGQSPSLHRTLTPLSLVVHLLDLYFDAALSLLPSGDDDDDDDDEEALSQVLASVPIEEGVMTPLITKVQTITTNELIRASAALGAGGSGLGLAKVAASLISTSSELSGKAPYSWVLGALLDGILTIVAEMRGRKEVGVDGEDDVVAVALGLAVSALECSLGEAAAHLPHLAREGREDFRNALGADLTSAANNFDSDKLLVALETAYEFTEGSDAIDTLVESPVFAKVLERTLDAV